MKWHSTPREERVALLREWAETDRLSSTAMAAKFIDRVSRSTIIGLCNREKITLHGKPGVRAKDPPEMVDDPVIKVRMRAPDLPNDPPLAGSIPVALVDATGCKWPVEGGYCNNPIHLKSYCHTHYAKAYRPHAPIHPLLVLLATEGPQPLVPNIWRGLLKDGLVMFRGRTVYITDRGRENTPGY